MLAMVHKKEMILPSGLADDIRSLGEKPIQNNVPVSAPGLTMKHSVSINAIDSRGMKEAYQQSSKDLVKTLNRQYRQFNTSGLKLS